MIEQSITPPTLNAAPPLGKVIGNNSAPITRAVQIRTSIQLIKPDPADLIVNTGRRSATIARVMMYNFSRMLRDITKDLGNSNQAKKGETDTY